MGADLRQRRRRQSAQFLATSVYYFMSAEVFPRQMGLSEGARRNTKSGGWITHRRVTRLGSSRTCGAVPFRGRIAGSLPSFAQVGCVSGEKKGSVYVTGPSWFLIQFDPENPRILKWMWPVEPTAYKCKLRVKSDAATTGDKWDNGTFEMYFN